MALRTSETTMTVSWTKLTIVESRGFIKNYKIFYYRIPLSRLNQLPNALNKTVGSEVSRANIDGLDENSAYEVQMSATTSAGDGAAGMPVSVSICEPFIANLFHFQVYFGC